MHHFLDHSFQDPSLNLALEEQLLAPMIKNNPDAATIRVWENTQPCIVLGRAEKTEQQIHLEEAQKQGVTVLRRTSGGGTVVHGPGNINLSFLLPYHLNPKLKSIHESYNIIIGWVRAALKEAYGLDTHMKGSSDISIGELKISGTAQARKRYGLLHHLTLLVDFDIDSIANLLKEPEKRPDYRGSRKHRQFVTTLKQQGIVWDRALFLKALERQIGPWSTLTLGQTDQDNCAALAQRKYQQNSWNIDGLEPPKP
jgi:lipoate-protein ligase A